jgi:RNA polymerase sigma factor (sigma-70 family)
VTSAHRNSTSSPVPTLGTAELLERWEPMLKGMARRVCRGLPESYVQDAEQVARIAFAEGLQECPGTDEPLRFTWGRNRAKQRLANWRKAFHTGSREITRSVSIDAENDVGRSYLDKLAAPAIHTVASDEAEAVAAAVETLPERERNVIRLMFWEGLCTAQIARLVGMTRAGMGLLVERTLGRLRQQLKAKGVRS